MRLVETEEAVLFAGLPVGFSAGFTTLAAPKEREDESLARALGTPGAERVRAKQVHGRAILSVDGPSGTGAARRLGAADGLVTGEPGRLLMVSTADCVPILLLDPGTGLLGAVHAGWRGTAAGIVEAAVDLLAARGADPRRLLALLGPSISLARYEVGPEVVAALGEAPEGALVRGAGDRSYVDVAAYARARLRARGVRDENVFSAPLCTHADARFPSYRRDGERAGRMLTGIVRTKTR